MGAENEGTPLKEGPKDVANIEEAEKGAKEEKEKEPPNGEGEGEVKGVEEEKGEGVGVSSFVS